MTTGGGGGGSKTQEQTPWAGAQPALLDVYSGAQDVYGSGGFGSLADQSGYTTQAQDMMAQYAMGGGSGLTPQAQGLASQTIQGDFLTGETNPYFQDALAYAQQPMIDAFNEQVAPGIDATFAGTAGGLGSGAYASQRNRAEDTLARNLAGAATQAGAQNYAQERGRQLQTMGAAPGLDQAGYGNFARLGQVGAAQDARSQMEALEQARNLQGFANVVQAMPQFGTTTAQQNSDPNWLATGAGLAMGAAPFFMSDRRAKQDIKRVGSLDIGTPCYRYRYRHEVAEMGDKAPYHLGPMAQEVEKVKPEAVVNLDGTLYVNAEAL